MNIIIDTGDAIGFELDAAYLILIQRGSVNEPKLKALLDSLEKAPAPTATTPPVSRIPQLDLDPVGFGIFATGDTSHVILVKKESANAQRICDFIRVHGKKILRQSP